MMHRTDKERKADIRSLATYRKIEYSKMCSAKATDHSMRAMEWFKAKPYELRRKDNNG